MSLTSKKACKTMTNHIHSLTITNFQSHRKTTVAPAPPGQLTVITGPSDNGKTAIFRALKLLYYNRPQGAEFTSFWATQTTVLLKTDKGDVSRVRSPGVNRYIANQVTLEGFGADVPLEVQEITGVRPTMIGDMPLTLNLAEQLDGPFLGNAQVSDAVRARILGKLAGTEEVDHANKLLGTDLYRRREDERRAKAAVEKLTEELVTYRSLPGLKARVESLTALAERLHADAADARALKDCLAGLKAQWDEVALQEAILARLVRVEEAQMAQDRAAAARPRLARLAQLRGPLVALPGEIEGLKRRIVRLTRVEESEGACGQARTALERVSALGGINTRLAAAKDAYLAESFTAARLAGRMGAARPAERAGKLRLGLVRLGEYRRNLTAEVARREAFDGHLNRAEAELGEARGLYAATLEDAGQCPLCGGEIDPEKIRGVV